MADLIFKTLNDHKPTHRCILINKKLAFYKNKQTKKKIKKIMYHTQHLYHESGFFKFTAGDSHPAHSHQNLQLFEEHW